MSTTARTRVVCGPLTKADLQCLVQEAVERRRSALVLHLARRIAAELEGRVSFRAETSEGAGDWNGVHSLSQLRAIVGGRFRNLKEKWIGAGLPIRAHRGDRQERPVVDPTGWAELAEWIQRQGFEVRLCIDPEESLFSVRRLADVGDSGD